MSQAWKKSEPDLWNLYHLSIEQLEILYPDAKHLRIVQLKYKREIDRGRIAMPEKHTFDGNLEAEKAEISKRRKSAPKIGQMVTLNVLEENLAHHQKLEEALSEGAVSRATFSSGSHEGYIKNADNEIEYTKPMENHQVRFSVEFDNEPKWPPVNRVESVAIPKREQSEKDRLRTSKRAMVLSDLQIPFQDKNAVGVALEALRDYKPDKVVLVGDLLDLSAWSKYIQRPEWATATQEAVNQAHNLLAAIRKLAPTAEIVVLEGNHDKRMENYALNNAQAAFGLKRADQPEGWPVLSVPYLTAMDTLDIEYVSGYPANRYWINKNLQVRHGNIARKGNTAVAVAQEERVSTIFGHIHRVETQYLTHHTYDGGKTIGAWSIGCLCDIMGAVPSVKGGVDLSGRPVPNAENWQQGIAVVDYEDGDGAFSVQPIYINTFMDYSMIVNGRKYER